METLQAIATISLFNTGSLDIFKVKQGAETEILAGYDTEDPVWCTVDGNGFFLYHNAAFNIKDATRV